MTAAKGPMRSVRTLSAATPTTALVYQWTHQRGLTDYTGLQVPSLLLWGNQLLEPEQFTLNIREIIRLVPDWFYVSETKEWTELPFYNFPNDLPKMASGSQITNLTRLSASTTGFQVLAHKDFWFPELM